MLLAIVLVIAAQQAKPVPTSAFTSSVLWTLAAPDAGELGQSIAAIGDIDGDHVGDLLAGSPIVQDCFSAFAPGSVVFVSGVQGKILSSIVQTKVQSYEDGFFGDHVTAVGDVDGDGSGDAVFATVDSADFFFERGALVSGRTRAPLRALDRVHAGWPPRFAKLGDFDGDGRDEVAVQIRSGEDQSSGARYGLCILKIVPTKR